MNEYITISMISLVSKRACNFMSIFQMNPPIVHIMQKKN